MVTSSVRDILTEKSGAELLGACSLGDGFSYARWRNGTDRVSYPGAEHHTFSVYSRGYENARRLDRKIEGRNNSFCLMPAGTESDWEISGPIEFFHIYFKDKDIENLALSLYDKSGIPWSVPDIAYREDRSLTHLCQWFLHAPPETVACDSLLGEQYRILLMTYLIDRIFPSPSLSPARGGLSPRNCRLVREYMEENYGDSLSLKKLAGLTGLSEFHFLRMFRRSFAVTPHDYLSRIRVERAMEMIRDGRPLAHTALETGFSSQPHFSRIFKQYTGLTPALYGRRSTE